MNQLCFMLKKKRSVADEKTETIMHFKDDSKTTTTTKEKKKLKLKH